MARATSAKQTQACPTWQDQWKRVEWRHWTKQNQSGHRIVVQMRALNSFKWNHACKNKDQEEKEEEHATKINKENVFPCKCPESAIKVTHPWQGTFVRMTSSNEFVLRLGRLCSRQWKTMIISSFSSIFDNGNNVEISAKILVLSSRKCVFVFIY